MNPAKRERERERLQACSLHHQQPFVLNPCYRVGDPVCSVVFRDQGSLTSAAGDGGVQAGALGDADLGQLLGTGRVDPYRLLKVGEGGATPGHTHTHTHTHTHQRYRETHHRYRE